MTHWLVCSKKKKKKILKCKKSSLPNHRLVYIYLFPCH